MLKLSKKRVNSILWSYVEKLEHHVDRRELTIYQKDLCCTDMNGAIKLAGLIDSTIDRIVTFSGLKKDVEYIFDHNKNNWKCVNYSSC